MTIADTSCALLTPGGRGAIATIGVRGPGALAAVAQCFTPASGQSLASLPPGRVIYGHFRTAADSAEELVVGLIGPEEIEVHCHGGMAAAEAILAALAAAGCRVESWRERAIAEGRDPIAAAAIIALADARTERTAAILLDQFHGALRGELSLIRDLIVAGNRQARDRLQSLLDRGELGLHLTRPWRVVITGPPNVGKSSLINALLGYQRAIVFDQPGTTRDVLTATTGIDGWPVELADTAGLRSHSAGGLRGIDAIEAEGVARAMAQIGAADLVVEVVDATEQDIGIERTEYSVLSTQYSAASAPLIVHNKCDLSPDRSRHAGLRVSAKTGQGIDTLIRRIAAQLVPDPPPRGVAVPFTESQIAVLDSVGEKLDRGQQIDARFQIETLLTPDS